MRIFLNLKCLVPALDLKMEDFVERRGWAAVLAVKRDASTGWLADGAVAGWSTDFTGGDATMGMFVII